MLTFELVWNEHLLEFAVAGVVAAWRTRRHAYVRLPSAPAAYTPPAACASAHLPFIGMQGLYISLSIEVI